MDESLRLTTFQRSESKSPKTVLWPHCVYYKQWCIEQVKLMWCKGLATARVHIELVNDVEWCCVVGG